VQSGLSIKCRTIRIFVAISAQSDQYFHFNLPAKPFPKGMTHCGEEISCADSAGGGLGSAASRIPAKPARTVWYAVQALRLRCFSAMVAASDPHLGNPILPAFVVRFARPGKFDD
jgi:hypothetical protein